MRAARLPVERARRNSAPVSSATMLRMILRTCSAAASALTLTSLRGPSVSRTFCMVSRIRLTPPVVVGEDRPQHLPRLLTEREVSAHPPCMPAFCLGRSVSRAWVKRKVWI